MTFIKYLLPFIIYLVSLLKEYVQTDPSVLTNQQSTVHQLMIEPEIGTDFLITNLMQWNPKKRLSIASNLSFIINNLTQKYFNHLKTNYNYFINQKLGVVTSFYAKKSIDTYLLMVGATYTSNTETIDSEDCDKEDTSISSLSPDYGLMYHLKKGLKRCFFTYRKYVPFYKWLAKSALNSNMNNIVLEFDIGVSL